ncbi:MAG: hypothetical protein WC236_15270 [Gallionellaceae bacterium]
MKVNEIAESELTFECNTLGVLQTSSMSNQIDQSNIFETGSYIKNNVVMGFEEYVLDVYNELNNAFQNENFHGIDDLAANYFGVWTDSSGGVLTVLGEDKFFGILKKLSIDRELFWGYYEYQYFEYLQDDLVIYRGGSGSKDDVLKGYSWTTDIEIAQEFAGRLENGVVLSAEILKDDVMLVNSCQNEVVPMPSALRNISIIANAM